jgi:hypothetical protein
MSEAVKSAKRPCSLHELKALNMGIAGLEPHQLATDHGDDGRWIHGFTGSITLRQALQQIRRDRAKNFNSCDRFDVIAPRALTPAIDSTSSSQDLRLGHQALRLSYQDLRILWQDFRVLRQDLQILQQDL